MTYSHEAYRRPHGLDVKHIELEARPSGLLVPRMIAVSRVAVHFAEYRMEGKLDIPDEFERLVYAKNEDRQPEVARPFLSRDANTLDEFSTIGASTNLDAVDDVRNVPRQSEIAAYRIFVLPDLTDAERDAVIEMSQLTAASLHQPFNDLTSEDLA